MPLKPEEFKMNVDEAIFSKVGRSGMEATIRDEEGTVIATISHQFLQAVSKYGGSYGFVLCLQMGPG